MTSKCLFPLLAVLTLSACSADSSDLFGASPDVESSIDGCDSVEAIGSAWICDDGGEAVLSPHALIPADGHVWHASLDLGGRVPERVQIVARGSGDVDRPPSFGPVLAVEAYDTSSDKAVLLGVTQDDASAPAYLDRHSIVVKTIGAPPAGFDPFLLRAFLQAPQSDDPTQRLAILAGPIVGFGCR